MVCEVNEMIVVLDVNVNIESKVYTSFNNIHCTVRYVFIFYH